MKIIHKLMCVLADLTFSKSDSTKNSIKNSSIVFAFSAK